MSLCSSRSILATYLCETVSSFPALFPPSCLPASTKPSLLPPPSRGAPALVIKGDDVLGLSRAFYLHRAYLKQRDLTSCDSSPSLDTTLIALRTYITQATHQPSHYNRKPIYQESHIHLNHAVHQQPPTSNQRPPRRIQRLPARK